MVKLKEKITNGVKSVRILENPIEEFRIELTQGEINEEQLIFIGMLAKKVKKVTSLILSFRQFMQVEVMIQAFQAVL